MSSPSELSFLPDDYLERKAQRRTNVICASLFVVVMAAIGSAFTITEQTLKTVERDHAAIEKEYTEAAKRIKLVQDMQEKQRRMAHQAELTASLLEKVPRSFLLAEVTNDLPAGLSLLDFTLESKKKSPAQPAVAKNAFEKKTGDDKPGSKKKGAADTTALAPPVAPEVSIKLSGIASTDVQVAAFISKLNQSKYLKDVNLLISEEDEQNEEKVRKFVLEARLDPSAEVTVETKPVKTVSVELKE